MSVPALMQKLDASRPYAPSYPFWWNIKFYRLNLTPSRACHGTANTEIIPTALPPLVSCQVMFVTKNEITSFKIRPDWSVPAAGDCRRLLFSPFAFVPPPPTAVLHAL